jgi:hypothetical protein
LKLKADFAGACNLVDEMTDEEYVVATQSFHVARTQQFTDPETGQIVFEQHEDDEPRPGLDGIPA